MRIMTGLPAVMPFSPSRRSRSATEYGAGGLGLADLRLADRRRRYGLLLVGRGDGQSRSRKQPPQADRREPAAIYTHDALALRMHYVGFEHNWGRSRAI